jgi:hypothetical protein
MEYTIIAILSIAAASLLYLQLSGKSGNEDSIKEILYSFVLQAEKLWGDGTGEAKKAYVTQLFYTMCPIALQKLITPERLSNLIEVCVRKMKSLFLNKPDAEAAILGVSKMDSD